MQSVEAVCGLLLASISLTVYSVQAQACGVPKGNPYTVLSSSDILKESFNELEKATFKCTVGYEIKGGTTSVTCTAGTWSNLSLICEKKSCGSPGDFLNGHFDIGNGIEFGGTVVAICNEGYTLQNSGIKRCEANGWTGNDPVCEVVRCPPPPPIANAEAPDPTQEIYDFGDAFIYTCHAGFTRDGPASITCSANASFQPHPPKCIKVVCPTPEIEHAVRIDGGRPPYGFNDFVTYKCQTDHTMVGAKTLTCGINSEWSSSLPVCKEIPTTTTTKAPSTTPTRTTTHTSVPVSGRVPVDPTQPPSEPHTFNWWYVCGPLLAVAGVVVPGLSYYLFEKKSSRGDYSGKLATRPTVDDDPGL